MKQILCWLLCASMLFSTAAVCAEENPMQSALLSVKSKADIPLELTEFDSRTFNSDTETMYYFTWYNEERTRELEISCDADGKINSYTYHRTQDSDEEYAMLSTISRDVAKTKSEDFLRKILPEAFTKDDILVCNDEQGSVNRRGTRYSFEFIRQKNGINVNNNNVSVEVIASGEDLYISNMWSNYDYTAEFIMPETEIADAYAAYKTAFPLKLHYVKDYDASQGMSKDVTELIYSVSEYGSGYISAENGEKIEENYEFRTLTGNGDGAMKEEAAEDLATSSFTETELKELEAVAKLKSPAEIEATLRGLDDLKMEDTLTLESYNIYKNNYIPYPVAKNTLQDKSEDKYTMTLHFRATAENRYLNASADAKTGEISYISNNKYDYDRPYDNSPQKELSEKQKAFAASKATSFFRLIAPKICDDFEIDEVSGYSQTASTNFKRMANGIEYSDNYASISYDIENEMISYYAVHYTEAEFEDPAPAIEAESESYNILLNRFPLEKIFICTDNGKYELCYQMSGCADLNALTGKIKESDEKNIGGYTDIKGHWSETAVNALADVGIGFCGNNFNPDMPITKAELLSLFAAGLKGYTYLDISEIMDEMKRTGIIPKNEPIENGDSPVAREDACVYMVRLAGHEKIARLDIFKTEFADQDAISDGKLGYAAILSGMGIVCGHGGYLRPVDFITRAEAATMLYQYLITK